MYIKQLLGSIALSLVTTTASAAIFTFDFTGRLIVSSTNDEPVPNDNGLPYTPIAASLTLDTDAGLGSSDLEVSVINGAFLGAAATFRDITVGTSIYGDNFLDGNVVVDWNMNVMNMNVVWDATGLFNAIDFGLQVGDTISGTNLIRDGSTIFDVGSATTYSDTVIEDFYNFQGWPITPDLLQGTAPMASSPFSFGFIDGPLFGAIRGHLDIGSGNSLHVTSISNAVVPVPAAVWLFGSGLLGLIALARRRH